MAKKKVKKLKEEKASDSKKQNELQQIADEIRRITINVKREMYRKGELLTKGQRIVDHGEFKEWVMDNFEFSFHTAHNFMNVYKHCLGRPELVKTIKAAILYRIAAPDFPKDLREYILVRMART